MTINSVVSDVDTRAANRLGGCFYLATALVALVGATSAAVQWLGAPWWQALAAVAVVEMGGIVLSAQADVRRRLGEHAIAYRVLSATVAAFAVAFQWLGHGDHRQGLFFAGVSALAYGTWLIHSGARRRDQLRGRPGTAALLAPASPAYGAQWIAHPWLTRRARDLFRRDTTLGLYGSLDAATEQHRTERRTAAIVKVLRRKLTAAAGSRAAAQVAITTYDLDRIAAGLAHAADYPGLTVLLAADLDPRRVTGCEPARAAVVPDGAAEPARSGRRAMARAAGRGAETAAKVARVRDRHPDLSTRDIARRLGITDRTVRRHLAGLRGTGPAEPVPAVG